MNLIDPSIDNFARSFTQEESPLLKKIDRETNLKVLQPRMLSGHLQGQVLAMLSHMITPERILEIGTYTGYSAICLAEGLVENGKLHTIESNEELEPIFTKYFIEAGLENQIVSHIGNAIDVIPEITDKLDLVFIDADKQNYSNYFSLTIDKVKSGGYIIADNVLWSGKVIESRESMDEETLALVEYCETVANDTRVEQVLLPIRDGLLIARKV